MENTTENLNFFSEEEKFRILELVKTWGFNATTILARLEKDHDQIRRELDKFDSCACPMWDCLVDTHQSYLKSKGMLPYQRWDRFRERFELWLQSTARTKINFEEFDKEFGCELARLRLDGVMILLDYIVRRIQENGGTLARCSDSCWNDDTDALEDDHDDEELPF